jgi:hypothetical protein
MRLDKILWVVVWSAITLIALCFFLSCTTVKKTSSDKKEFDYSLQQRLIDSNRVLREDNIRLQQELRQAEYATAEFDSTKCPKIVFPACPDFVNADSVNRLVNDLNNAIEGLNNKVKFYADGSIEYTGRLKQFKYANEKQSITIANLKKVVDSLTAKRSEKKESVRVVTEYKTEYKKVTVFPWYFWLITGLFAFLFINAKFKFI